MCEQGGYTDPVVRRVLLDLGGKRQHVLVLSLYRVLARAAQQACHHDSRLDQWTCFRSELVCVILCSLIADHLWHCWPPVNNGCQ